MRLNQIISMKEQYKFYIYFSLCMKIILPYNCLFSFIGSKNLATPTHFISSPRLTPRRKKCLRTNEESPNCQETLPRTILFSATRDHGRRKRHATKGSLPEHPKGKHKCNETAMRVQWRRNSKISCHIRIKYTQLTSQPHLCGHDPWTALFRSPQLTKGQKEWLMGRALKYMNG